MRRCHKFVFVFLFGMSPCRHVFVCVVGLCSGLLFTLSFVFLSFCLCFVSYAAMLVPLVAIPLSEAACEVIVLCLGLSGSVGFVLLGLGMFRWGFFWW